MSTSQWGRIWSVLVNAQYLKYVENVELLLGLNNIRDTRETNQLTEASVGSIKNLFSNKFILKRSL